MRVLKLAAIVGAIIMLALPMSSKPADASIYTLTLDSFGAGLDGTGILEVINPPANGSILTPSALVPEFSISIGSSIFDLTDDITRITFGGGNVININALTFDPAFLATGGGSLFDVIGFSYFGPNGEVGVGTINIAAAVPEASTWAMMILGFAAVGFIAYRRSRKDQGLALAA